MKGSNLTHRLARSQNKGLSKYQRRVKIASIRNRDNRDDLIDELIDRFGDPNRPVMNLIETAHLKALCSRMGIDYVTNRGDELMMRFSMSADIDPIRVLTALKGASQYLRVKPINPMEVYYFERGKDPEALLRGAVKVMEDVMAAFEAGATGEEPDGGQA